jgi:hypothetical protein
MNAEVVGKKGVYRLYRKAGRNLANQSYGIGKLRATNEIIDWRDLLQLSHLSFMTGYFLPVAVRTGFEFERTRECKLNYRIYILFA